MKHLGNMTVLRERVRIAAMQNTRAGGKRQFAMTRLLVGAGIEPPAIKADLEAATVELVEQKCNRQNVNRMLGWLLSLKDGEPAPPPKFLIKTRN